MNWIPKWEKFISTMQNEIFQRKLVDGFCNTVQVAVLGLIIGIVIGSLIAVIKVAPKYKLVYRILDKICRKKEKEKTEVVDSLFPMKKWYRSGYSL